MATASSPSRTVSSAVSPKRSASISSGGAGGVVGLQGGEQAGRGRPGQAEAAGQRRRRAVALPLAQEGQQRERSMDGLGLLGTDSRKLTSAFRRYNVTATLAPVVDRLFDDASLFPPAQLPMQAALAAHDRLRRDASTAPLVGPFLCPASRFPELDTCLASGLPRPPELGVIAYDGDAPWATVYATPGIVQVEAPQSARPPEPPRQVHRYVEIARGLDTDAVAAALDEMAASGARAKVRCGGPTPDDVPRCDWLAGARGGGARGGPPLEGPPRVHHPLRSTERGDLRHGLVNLLAAAGAAHAGADVTTVSEVLASEEAAADTSALVEHAAGARELLMSVGTCSIDETAEGLRSRGLL